MQRRWLLIGMVSLGLALGGCGRRASTPVGADGQDEIAPQQISWGARFVMDEGGQRRAALAAARVERYRRGDSTFALLRGPSDGLRDRVTAWLFDVRGDSSATLTADSLIYYDQEGRFEAFGHVVVVTDEGKRLESEFLTWDEGERKIRTDRFVQITTPSERVEGHGLVADENLDTYQIGRFTAQVVLADSTSSSDSSRR